MFLVSYVLIYGFCDINSYLGYCLKLFVIYYNIFCYEEFCGFLWRIVFCYLGRLGFFFVDILFNLLFVFLRKNEKNI